MHTLLHPVFEAMGLHLRILVLAWMLGIRNAWRSEDQHVVLFVQGVHTPYRHQHDPAWDRPERCYFLGGSLSN